MNPVHTLFAVLVLSSWGVGEGCGCQTFSPPEGATKIGELDLYIEGTKVTELPTPSSDPAAPRIVAIRGYKTSPTSFEMHFEVESYRTIEYVYLDFDTNGIYKAAVTEVLEAGTDAPPTACGVAAQQQGITCTQACLAACGCLTDCPDEQIELNAEQACALNCTIADNSNALNGPPYNGSEKTFASVVYNGLPSSGLIGVATQAKCSASKCGPPPDPNQKKKKRWSMTFSTPTVPMAQPIFDSICQQDMSTPVATSEPFGKASVEVCDMPYASDACFL